MMRKSAFRMRNICLTSSIMNYSHLVNRGTIGAKWQCVSKISRMKRGNNSRRAIGGVQILGGVMFYGAIAVVIMCWINCCANREEVNEHPWKTIFSGGANLSHTAYNFLPPWTGFEFLVLLTGGIGWLLTTVPIDESKKSSPPHSPPPVAPLPLASRASTPNAYSGADLGMAEPLPRSADEVMPGIQDERETVHGIAIFCDENGRKFRYERGYRVYLNAEPQPPLES